MSLTLNEIFNGNTIRKRAELSWNEKSYKTKIMSMYKYRHILKKYYPNEENSNWNITFDQLSRCQQNILIKGELIRTYDLLPNHDKTRIKKEFKLSRYSSKWYKLDSKDKKKLLNHMLH